MMIFMPYPDIDKSVECLSFNHLNVQKSWVKTLAHTYLEPTRWQYHPTFKSWKPYYQTFQYYHDCVIREWLKRGYQTKQVLFEAPKPDKRFMPWFIGEEKYHSAMRSNLLRKDPTYREREGWTESTDLPYLWPNNNNYQFETLETAVDWYNRMGWSTGKRVKKPGPQPKNRALRVKKLDNLYEVLCKSKPLID